MDVNLGLESEEHAAREGDRLAFVRRGHLAVAGRSDDAPHRRSRGDEIADRPHQVQDARLGDHATKRPDADAGGHELGQPQEHGRERQLRSARDAGGIVEELAEEQLHPARMRRGPRDEASHDGVEARRPRLVLVLERARQLREEVRADLGEHGRVQLLLLREVVDDRRERHTGGVRDVAHAGPVKPGRREQALGDPYDLVASAGPLRRVTPQGRGLDVGSGGHDAAP